MKLYEDYSTKGDVKAESVSVTIECHPGQKASIIYFLSGVVKQAGVYSVEVTDGERLVQQANQDAHAEDGRGSETIERGDPEVEPERVEPELAGFTGQVWS